MTKFFSKFLLFCLSIFFIQGQANETITDKNTQVTFPKEISFIGNNQTYHLQATGVATRKKLMIKVYSVAHYLESKELANKELYSKEKIMEKIFSNKTAKQFTLKWLRDVGNDKVSQAFLSSFHKVFPDSSYEAMKLPISQLMQILSQNVNAGDEHYFRWLPPSVVEVWINKEKKGTIDNEEFAYGLWNIWFSEQSIVNRSDLISLINN